MPFTKEDTAIAVGVGLVLLGAGKAFASSSTSSSKKKGAKSGDKSPEEDCANLQMRANQPTALAWVPYFMGAHAMHKGVPIHITAPWAEALARWAGIESSGNPLITSRLDERGLMQAGPQSVSEGLMSQSDWVALTDPDTSHEQQADMAILYADAMYGKAKTHITDPPADPTDEIWYAKMWHQRPVDVRDGKFHGPARAMARELAARWANDPKAMHRLRAANMVAFGTCAP
jgi:hypothetical protein